MLLKAHAERRPPVHLARSVNLNEEIANRSGVGLLSIVRVAYRLSKAMVQLAASQNDLLRMNGLDRRERHDELASILYIDHKFGPAVRGDFPNCAEFLAAV